VDLQTHILMLAPPRSGKSALLARIILHFCGPVVSTTTKADIFALTSGVRARRGPVMVFNPQNIGGVPSTFRWNPIAGCEDPATAIRRADAFTQSVSQRGVEDATFWSQMASDWLRAMFQAAALGGKTMLHVAAWSMSGNASEAETILLNSRQFQAAQALSQMRSAAQKTAATIQMSLSRALSFLTDPSLAASVLPAEGDGFDIAAFLKNRGTLYMIAESRNEESPLAPLFACLAGEVHYEAVLLGSQAPGGRLDPPLLLALDEITQVCPLPLPSLLADSGGKGIQIIPVVHGEAQMRSRWHADGSRVIQDTCGVKLILPGVTDPDTLKAASQICGTTALKERGSDDVTRAEVMTPDMISRLPAGYGLVIRGGSAPVVARLCRGWKDRLYRRAKRHGYAVAAITAAPGRPVTPEPPAIGGLSLVPPAPKPAPAAPAAALEPYEDAEPVAAEMVPAEDEEIYPWSAGR